MPTSEDLSKFSTALANKIVQDIKKGTEGTENPNSSALPPIAIFTPAMMVWAAFIHSVSTETNPGKNIVNITDVERDNIFGACYNAGLNYTTCEAITNETILALDNYKKNNMDDQINEQITYAQLSLKVCELLNTPVHEPGKWWDILSFSKDFFNLEVIKNHDCKESVVHLIDNIYKNYNSTQLQDTDEIKRIILSYMIDKYDSSEEKQKLMNIVNVTFSPNKEEIKKNMRNVGLGDEYMQTINDDFTEKLTAVLTRNYAEIMDTDDANINELLRQFEYEMKRLWRTKSNENSEKLKQISDHIQKEVMKKIKEIDGDVGIEYDNGNLHHIYIKMSGFVLVCYIVELVTYCYQSDDFAEKTEKFNTNLNTQWKNMWETYENICPNLFPNRVDLSDDDKSKKEREKKRQERRQQRLSSDEQIKIVPRMLANLPRNELWNTILNNSTLTSALELDKSQLRLALYYICLAIPYVYIIAFYLDHTLNDVMGAVPEIYTILGKRKEKKLFKKVIDYLFNAVRTPMEKKIKVPTVFKSDEVDDVFSRDSERKKFCKLFNVVPEQEELTNIVNYVDEDIVNSFKKLQKKPLKKSVFINYILYHIACYMREHIEIWKEKVGLDEWSNDEDAYMTSAILDLAASTQSNDSTYYSFAKHIITILQCIGDEKHAPPEYHQLKRKTTKNTNAKQQK